METRFYPFGGALSLSLPILGVGLVMFEHLRMICFKIYSFQKIRPQTLLGNMLFGSLWYELNQQSALEAMSENWMWNC